MSITPDIHPNTGSPLSSERDSTLFADISGENGFGRPKARIMLRHYTLFSDGTEDEHQALIVEKPILSVFKHAGFVNVRMDFRQVIDQDLLEIWEMLRYLLRLEIGKSSITVSHRPLPLIKHRCAMSHWKSITLFEKSGFPRKGMLLWPI